MLPSSSSHTEIQVIILTASGGAGHLNAAEQEKKNYSHKSCLMINVIEKGWLNLEWLIKETGLHVLSKIPYLASLFL